MVFRELIQMVECGIPMVSVVHNVGCMATAPTPPTRRSRSSGSSSHSNSSTVRSNSSTQQQVQ